MADENTRLKEVHRRVCEKALNEFIIACGKTPFANYVMRLRELFEEIESQEE